MLRIFEKRLSVDVKAKYLFLDIRLLVVKTEWGSLADIAYEARRRDVDWLGGHSANHEALGCFAPPPYCKKQYKMHLIINV